MSVHYIVALFPGTEPKNIYDNSRSAFEAHTGAIAASASLSDIQKITFAVNTSDVHRDGPMVEKAYADSRNALVPKTQLVIRPNCGFSYGAWQEVIHSEAEENNDFFLIESDYLPSGEFLVPFKAELTSDHGFVAQKISSAPFPHASVSNGYLSSNWAKIATKSFGTVFSIYPFLLGRADYLIGCENQLTFLNFIRELGGKVTEISPNLSCLFWNSDLEKVVELGRSGGWSPIRPIQSGVDRDDSDERQFFA
jgi:hypothetical protein